MNDWYIRRHGHCTRCARAFAVDERLYLVREKVAWRLRSGVAFTQEETVPVCRNCTTDAELRQAVNWTKPCLGCGREMVPVARSRKGQLYVPSTCSMACAKKARRRSKRQKRVTCGCCGMIFSSTRRDARWCSPACSQRAYRQRLKTGVSRLNGWAARPAAVSSGCQGKGGR